MCGRYTISHTTEEILERFNVLKEELEIAANYNVAPSHTVPIIVVDQQEDAPKRNTMQLVKWGLVPFWVRDPKTTKPFINARAETLIEKPSFKSCFSRKRCIIPADGFYEWKKEGKSKIPMRIHLPDDSIFGLAGIYDDWKTPEGNTIRTCAIITVPCNDAMAPIHNRMPAILTPSFEADWLNPFNKNLQELHSLLHPYQGDLDIYPVSPLVNSVAKNSPELLERANFEMVSVSQSADTSANSQQLQLPFNL